MGINRLVSCWCVIRPWPYRPRYRIVSLLGRGGMGEVYRAHDLQLQETIALKLLPSANLDALGLLAGGTAHVSHTSVPAKYSPVEASSQHLIFIVQVPPLLDSACQRAMPQGAQFLAEQDLEYAPGQSKRGNDYSEPDQAYEGSQPDDPSETERHHATES